jgi:hypothetical protein
MGMHALQFPAEPLCSEFCSSECFTIAHHPYTKSSKQPTQGEKSVWSCTVLNLEGQVKLNVPLIESKKVCLSCERQSFIYWTSTV